MQKLLKLAKAAQISQYAISDSSDSYDLTISIKKTEVVYQPAPGKPKTRDLPSKWKVNDCKWKHIV